MAGIIEIIKTPMIIINVTTKSNAENFSFIPLCFKNVCIGFSI